MSQLSLGLIETIGLAAAVEAADAAVKSANVDLVGYEFAKGAGMTVVKLQGEVGAIKAAVAAGAQAASRVNKVVATDVIARPGVGMSALIGSSETRGTVVPAAAKAPAPSRPRPSPRPNRTPSRLPPRPPPRRSRRSPRRTPPRTQPHPRPPATLQRRKRPSRRSRPGARRPPPPPRR